MTMLELVFARIGWGTAEGLGVGACVENSLPSIALYEQLFFHLQSAQSPF